MNPVQPEIQTKAHIRTDRRSYDWDVKQAPGNYLVLIGSHAITALFSFATVLTITKIGGSEAYGGVVAFIAASQLVQIFLNWSLTALLRFGVEEYVTTGKITHAFWTRSWIWIINVTIALVAAHSWLDVLAGAFRLSPDVKHLLLLHIAASSLWLHIQYALQAAKMMRLQGYFLATERVLIFSLMIMFWRADRLDAASLLWCFVLPPALMSIIATYFLRGYVELHGFFSSQHFKEVIRFSLPLIPFVIISYLATSQLDAYFITQFMSTRDLGVYAIATQINGTLLQLPILANSILLPMFVSIRTLGQDPMLRRIFADAVPAATLVWSGGLVLLAVVCGFLIPIVFGIEYTEASTSLWVLLSSSTLIFPILLGMATLSNTYSKTYVSMYASTFAATVNVVFDILLIPRYGMAGCAWASVLSAATSLVVFTYLLRRAGLLPGSWTLLAVLPMVASAAMLTASGSVLPAIGTFAVAAAILAMSRLASLRAAGAMLRLRLGC